MKIIYKYTNLATNKVCYIGQTVDLAQRRYQHEIQEAFNSSRHEYNYPLSRAIRKYGVENFHCDIIEIVPINLANEREQYWINYYDTYKNGYNQNIGGNASALSKTDIEEVYQLLQENFSYQKISDLKNISLALISNINLGKAYYDPNKKYPISERRHGSRLNEDILSVIREELMNKEKTIRDLSNEYNIGFNVIVRINQGTGYYNENYTYPLRTGRVRKKK